MTETVLPPRSSLPLPLPLTLLPEVQFIDLSKKNMHYFYFIEVEYIISFNIIVSRMLFNIRTYLSRSQFPVAHRIAFARRSVSVCVKQ